jgi:hypothetical protein
MGKLIPRWESLRAQLKKLFNKVGSYLAVGENFLLTLEVMAGFTEKVKTDRGEPDGC